MLSNIPLIEIEQYHKTHKKDHDAYSSTTDSLSQVSPLDMMEITDFSS